MASMSIRTSPARGSDLVDMADPFCIVVQDRLHSNHSPAGTPGRADIGPSVSYDRCHDLQRH